MTAVSNRFFPPVSTLKIMVAALLLTFSGEGLFAGTTPHSFLPAQLWGDTAVKMIAGVPILPTDISPLLIGESIPILVLQTSTGKSINLNQAVAQKPTILVFYRGGWCPYCTKELSGLMGIEEQLTKEGYQIIAISTDSPENLGKTMDKQKLSYTLLSDADLKGAKLFGIAYKSPANYDQFLPQTSGGKNVDKLLPVPSVFILNQKGEIQFEYINPDFKKRISPALLLASARAIRIEE